MSEREGASKTNEAVVVSMYPDVCVKDGKPVPYDLHGLASDDIRHSPNVNYTGNPTLNEGSRLSTSYGDEPAAAGVSSGVVKGMCRPVEGFASKVNVNSLPAVRHDTVFEMNTAGPAGASNTKGKLVYVRDQREVADDEAEKKRKATLEKLKEKYGKSDFYDQLGEYDPANADKWSEMSPHPAGLRQRRAGLRRGDARLQRVHARDAASVDDQHVRRSVGAERRDEQRQRRAVRLGTSACTAPRSAKTALGTRISSREAWA
jgi:hypothetical protein